MDMPYIPISDPGSQMDAVCDFCSSWSEPISVSYESKKMVMMTYGYYLEHFCTLEERERIEQAIAAHHAAESKPQQ